jgi:hypothetical protein
MIKYLPLIFLVNACGTSRDFNEAAAVEKGRSIAGASFQTLMARVTSAMQEGGPAHAVQYCSLQALPLVDSLSQEHGVRIRRTSDRVRAPHDRPDADERRALEHYLHRLEIGEEASSPVVYVVGDSVAYYQPIFIVSPNCLKCHGTPDVELDASAYAEIQRLYPQDEAIGYSEGEFRGLWSLRWPRGS